MTKRIIAAVLWFYSGWYLGAELALFFSLNPMLGPILGTAAAIFVVAVPGRIMSRTRSHAPQSTTVHPTTV